LPSRFPYEGIANELRASILDGRLEAGVRLPSENELAERYSTSRPTVRRALALLKAEGLVISEQGQAAEQRLLDVGRVAAPDDVAERLRVDGGAPVVARRRLFLVNGEPVALCDSYYPADVADGTALAEPERIAGGAYGLIEDPAGPIARRLKRSIDDLECRMPTPEEVDALELDLGVPVVRVLRTVYDSEGAAVEVQETVAAADKHQFRYEVAMR